MIKYILEGLPLLLFFSLLYALLIVGDVWEDKVRCSRGYQPACQALNIDK